LKTDIQTKCQNEKFKRQLLRALRTMYEDEQEEDDEQQQEDDEQQQEEEEQEK